MNPVRSLSFVFLAVCWIAVGNARAQDLSALVESVVATYGGSAALAKLQQHRVHAEVVALGRRTAGNVRRDFHAPGRLRVEIGYPDRTELRLLNDSEGWRGEPPQLRRVRGPARLAMVYQLLRSAPAWTLTHHRSQLRDRGARTVDGTRYRLVGLPWSRELDLTFWVDSVTRRIARTEGHIDSRGVRTTLGTVYSDFRRTDGVLHAWAEDNYASGRHTGRTRLSALDWAPEQLGPFTPGFRQP